MTQTMTFTGSLTIQTCWCGIVHAVPQSLYDYQQREKDAGRQFMIHCPLGHEWITSGESTAAKLRRELDYANNRAIQECQRHDQTKAELRETELRRRAQAGVTTRIKNRIANGVCPCCKRTFKDLHAHMTSQHPDFTKAE